MNQDCKQIEHIDENHIIDADTFTKEFKFIRQFDNGKGGGTVFLIKRGQKKFVMKIFDSPKTANLQEIFITCHAGATTKYFAKLHDVGVITALNPWSPVLRSSKSPVGSIESSILRSSKSSILRSSKSSILRSSKYVYMIIDYWDGYTSLGALNPVHYTDQQIMGILFQIADAFVMMGEDFRHLDLHMQNILVDTRKRQKRHTIRGYRFSAPPIGIIDLGWASLPTHTQAIKKLRNFLTFPILKKIKTQYPVSVKRIFSTRENMDFRYFRLITFVLIQQKSHLSPIPDHIHSFSQLFHSEWFDILKK